MTQYASKDLVITFTDSGATPRQITGAGTDFVREINGLEVEALLQESHGFGKSWVENLFTGMKKGNPITISGFYNDVANGPDALFKAIGDSRTIVITWGAAKTSTATVLIQKYTRQPINGETHKYTVTLVPSGAVTEA
jgi:hypothetical protein